MLVFVLVGSGILAPIYWYAFTYPGGIVMKIIDTWRKRRAHR